MSREEEIHRFPLTEMRIPRESFPSLKSKKNAIFSLFFYDATGQHTKQLKYV